MARGGVRVGISLEELRAQAIPFDMKADTFGPYLSFEQGALLASLDSISSGRFNNARVGKVLPFHLIGNEANIDRLTWIRQCRE